MADTYTPNLNLRKDDQDSYYNVDKFNGNLDLIDAAVKAAGDKGAAAQSTTDSHKTDPAAHPNGISGNAATATKAAQDGAGNNIATTYLPKSGGIITGEIQSNGAAIIRNIPSNIDMFVGSGNAGIYDAKNSRQAFTYTQDSNTTDVGNDSGTTNIHGNTHASLDAASTLNGHTADDFLRRLGGRTQPTITPLIDWDAMKAANNGVDVRNINNAGTGIVAYGGDNGFTNGWPASSIALKQPYTNFDKLYIVAIDDTGTLTTTSVRETWELGQSLQKGYSTLLISNDALYWYAMSSQKNGTTDHYLSTPTLLAGGANSQNCAIIEIYGVNY